MPNFRKKPVVVEAWHIEASIRARIASLETEEGKS